MILKGCEGKMQCPFCGDEMEQGFIYGRRDSGLMWLPAGEKMSFFITEHSIKARNGLLLGQKPFPEFTKLEFYVCRKCNAGVSKF